MLVFSFGLSPRWAKTAENQPHRRSAALHRRTAATPPSSNCNHNAVHPSLSLTAPSVRLFLSSFSRRPPAIATAIAVPRSRNATAAPAPPAPSVATPSSRNPQGNRRALRPPLAPPAPSVAIPMPRPPPSARTPQPHRWQPQRRPPSTTCRRRTVAASPLRHLSAGFQPVFRGIFSRF
ncbi:UNVERIFIED_CONTAM: hypothetical protein Sradi_4418500 [Sesamum radiatum]|uniref:Uncharacterized protein n=1 Tax=Sesamum radiatum TaxID=300843 RepID=A0AAW2NPQ3_SESRA